MKMLRHTYTFMRVIGFYALIIVAMIFKASNVFAATTFDVVTEDFVSKNGGATGGVEYRVVNNADGTFDVVHLFKNVGSSTLSIPANNNIKPNTLRFLAVGGGGGGSGNCGGGGGAGGYLEKNDLEVVAGDIAITVGDGGNPNGGGIASNGENTTITIGEKTYTALGGGASGNYNAQNGGKAGGSGGGGNGVANQPTSTDGGLGNKGGQSVQSNRGGGGGGAGSAGQPSTTSPSCGGKGGDGVQNDISGEEKWYAAGGGGTCGPGVTDHENSAADGGSGIGGKGGYSKVVGSNAICAGTAGAENTGSGGGGGPGGANNEPLGGGKGGSGIVIIRYTLKATCLVEGGKRSQVVDPTYGVQSVYTFDQTTITNKVKLNNAVKARLLLVGGGGAGANPAGSGIGNKGAGGGGGGEVKAVESVILKPGEYVITLGEGGASPEAKGAGGDGQSTILKFTANTIGATEQTLYTANGGKGGTVDTGAGGACGEPTKTGGAGGATQAGGGGGGAGGAGGAGSISGTVVKGGLGGDGLMDDITGFQTIYGGGGGGGTRLGTGAYGGLGGGGNGGGGTSSLVISPTAGEDALGGGGGGGRLNLKGGNGGSGGFILRVLQEMPSKVVEEINLTYNGEEQIALRGSDFITINKDSASGEVVANAVVKDAGDYTFVVKPTDDNVWPDGSADQITLTVKVAKAQLVVNKFTVPTWQIGMPQSKAIFESNFPLEEDDYKLLFSGEYGTEPYTDVAPTTAGYYGVKYELTEKGKKNFLEADPPAAGLYPPFVVVTEWTDPTYDEENPDTPLFERPKLGFYAELMVKSSVIGEETDYVVKVDISEGNPVGFSYSQAAGDGSDIRFLAADGSLLSSTIETWDATGTSSILVKLPTYKANTSFTMWWGQLQDALPPLPSEIVEPGTDDGSHITAGMAYICPDVNFENRWIELPSISPMSGSVGEFDPSVDFGAAAYGNVKLKFRSALSGEETEEMPTEKGSYLVIAEVEGSEEDSALHYSALSYEVGVIVISEENPYSSLSGDNSNVTMTGRVLLANDYEDGDEKVEDQSHYLTNATESASQKICWQHTDEIVPELTLHLQNGTNHKLVCTEGIEELCGSTNIWSLYNVRIGNTYTSSLNPASTYNYLPFSSKAKASLIQGGADGSQAESAHMLLRNIEGASIVSPCYTNGIGTIYFDAVNGEISADGKGYEIVLEICTNAVLASGSALPTDENLTTTTIPQVIKTDDDDEPVYDDETGEVVYEDGAPIIDPYGAAEWIAVKMMPLRVSGTNVTKNADTENLALDVNTGGGQDQFYRVVAKIDCTSPIRFRIRRVSRVGDTASDDAHLILIDNIIASYPTMRAKLEPFGRYDSTRDGKQIVGWENAWSVPYPSIKSGDVTPRAKVSYYTNPAQEDIDEKTLIASARMLYRWRYLEQEITDWKSVFLTLNGENYAATNPLELPEGRVGDIEFFFETQLASPFYSYYNYSGSQAVLGEHYSEQIVFVTNKWEGSTLPSQGKDWFVRLREGDSDYSSASLVIKRTTKLSLGADEVVVTNTIPMELEANHVWRGCLQTLTNMTGTIEYRVEMKNKQETNATAYAENEAYWHCGEEPQELPISTVMSEGDANSWTKLTIDAATGYYLFQMDDRTKSLTVVHADYQNFNAWTDAKRGVFVGTSTEDEAKIGTSSIKQTYRKSFAPWRAMPTENDDWYLPTLAWTTLDNIGGRTPNKFFGDDTSAAWQVNNAAWVARQYRDNASGVAVQLQGWDGSSSGMASLTGSYMPRGLDTVSFNARLGQGIDFYDFVYYDAGNKRAMTNYTFFVKAAFDLNNNNDFNGAACLSLIAYYTSDGFYEFRMEKRGKNDNALGYSLYRWRYKNYGKLSCELLGTRTITTAPPRTLGQNGTYMPLFLSVESTEDDETGDKYTAIYAGFGHNGCINRPDTAIESFKNFTFGTIVYRDKSAARLTAGTYGLLSANSPAVFLQPTFLEKATSFDETNVQYNSINQFSSIKPQFQFNNGATCQSCRDDLKNGNWVPLTAGRMIHFDDEQSGNQWGLRANAVSQNVSLWMQQGTDPTWKKLKTFTIDNFGSLNSAANRSVKVAVPDATSFKFTVDGIEEDDESIIGVPKCDVVVDTLKLTQFAGVDWNEENAVRPYITPDWAQLGTDFALTNFTFSSAWLARLDDEGREVAASATSLPEHYGVVRLSGRRTTTSKPSAIISPLMDGYTYLDGSKRGIGLGMFSYEYRNAQTNTVLLLQICTNGWSAANMAALNKYEADVPEDSLLWHTIGTNTFNDVSEDDLKHGARSFYIGLRGVQGVMRLVVDPDCVASVQRVDELTDDPTAFGEIDIVSVVCRDEPMLDETSWWGWNMRTLGPDGRNTDAEKRMYLPDLTVSYDNPGLSLALNNSITEDTVAEDEALYPQHMPFVQSPTFGTNVVGSVTFRARVYNTNEVGQVSVYGTKRLGDAPDSEWVCLTNIVVDATTYKTYTYLTSPGDDYAAFRLGVTGVNGVVGEMGEAPSGGAKRVLIDEVLVSEAIRARMAFRNVGAFRSQMNDPDYVPNVPSKEEQPLCKEDWGIQCEIFATQLAEEIDWSKDPEVTLHWFVGQFPWGYENWKTNAAAKSAKLLRVDMSGVENKEGLYYYRVTNVNPDAEPLTVIHNAGEVVQYMLEVKYGQLGQSGEIVNYLEPTDWELPSWYSPVDYNSGKPTFAAFSIFDTVAPGWAWINEVNIFGRHTTGNYDNDALDAQFVEVAAPQVADLKNWSVRMIEASISSDFIITNTVGIFAATSDTVGSLLGTKKEPQNVASNMVFHVLGSPNAHKSRGGKLDPAAGEIDGMWDWGTNGGSSSSLFKTDKSLDLMTPVAIQLVRASGIIEHEVLCVGTNFFGSLPAFQDTYSLENVKNYIQSKMPKSNLLIIGDDDKGYSTSEPEKDFSLSVLTGRGTESNNWSNQVVRTPGKINAGQEIVGEPPEPQGETVIIFSELDNDFGHIYQQVGGIGDKTNALQIIYMKRGNEDGTNIVYHLDRWFDLGTITTNDIPLPAGIATAGATNNASKSYTLNIGKGMEKNIRLKAGAKINDDLVNVYGLADDNRYKDAVMDWLFNGKTLCGDFANTSEEIKLAKFWSLSQAETQGDLTLTQMYWLDMDPTVGDLALRGGIMSGPTFVERECGESIYSNVQLNVKMYITNLVEETSSDNYGKAWTPYVLRGLTPGEVSDDPARIGNWTSVTFKVRGLLKTENTTFSNENNWVSLRFFKFAANSFNPLTAEENPGEAKIEIIDPKTKASLGYTSGWEEWLKANPGALDNSARFFYSWRLDDNALPVSVETLTPNSIFEEETND